MRSPGPLRAFYERVRARRGNHVAAVAVARKLTVLIWHMLTKGEDYAWGRPMLMARKLRSLELAAGRAPQRGQRGSAYDYNLPDRREADRAQAEQAENACRRLTQHWRQQNKRKGAGAADEARH